MAATSENNLLEIGIGRLKREQRSMTSTSLDGNDCFPVNHYSSDFGPFRSDQIRLSQCHTDYDYSNYGHEVEIYIFPLSLLTTKKFVYISSFDLLFVVNFATFLIPTLLCSIPLCL